MSLLCILQITDALAVVKKHKALTQKQEFIALMTGQKLSDKTSASTSMVRIDLKPSIYLLTNSILYCLHHTDFWFTKSK